MTPLRCNPRSYFFPLGVVPDLVQGNGIEWTGLGCLLSWDWGSWCVGCRGLSNWAAVRCLGCFWFERMIWTYYKIDERREIWGKEQSSEVNNRNQGKCGCRLAVHSSGEKVKAEFSGSRCAFKISCDPDISHPSSPKIMNRLCENSWNVTVSRLPLLVSIITGKKYSGGGKGFV